MRQFTTESSFVSVIITSLHMPFMTEGAAIFKSRIVVWCCTQLHCRLLLSICISSFDTLPLLQTQCHDWVQIHLQDSYEQESLLPKKLSQKELTNNPHVTQITSADISYALFADELWHQRWQSSSTKANFLPLHSSAITTSGTNSGKYCATKALHVGSGINL